jgi:hypothetical protein
VTSITPFLYNGSGKDLSHIGGLDWGTDFFGNPTGNLAYKNIKTGVTESTSMEDASKNYSHNVQLLMHYNFNDNLKLKLSGRWNYVPKAGVPLQICTQTFDMQNTKMRAQVLHRRHGHQGEQLSLRTAVAVAFSSMPSSTMPW